MHILVNLLSLILSWLSPSSLGRCAKFLSFMSYRVFRVRRKLILSNLETAFGTEKSPEDRDKIGELSTYHFILTALEFLAERRGRLGDKVEILEGEEHLRNTVSQGKGVYILCIHMGSWEAMGGGLTRLGYPAHVIVKKVGSEKTDQFVKKLRRQNGFYCIQRRSKGDAVKGIIRTLKAGHVVGFVMDQARPGEPFLPFFNKPAKTNTSFAAIWRKIQAPIIPAFILRTGVGEHKMHVLPPLSLHVTEDAEKDVIEHSRLFNTVVESMIRKCPEQYFWMHNRWKS